MALPSKTIESMERMAERLETWAKGWGKQMLRNRPQNLRQFRASLLALSGSTSFPELDFKMEFHAGLSTALERFDYIKEELQHYMPDMATTVQKEHEDLAREAKSIGPMALDDPTWFKEFNKSRNLAKDLALVEAAARGLRTYAMFCPLLPAIADSQEDIERLIKFAMDCRAEEIFVEPVNPRGPGLRLCQEALEQKGFAKQAKAIAAIRQRAVWSQLRGRADLQGTTGGAKAFGYIEAAALALLIRAAT